jgi:parallel beta-helix repeat protein
MRCQQSRRLSVEQLEARLVPSTYYVANTGNDSDNGSQAHPFATMQHAMMSLQPGDTLDVEAGSYAGFIIGWDSVPASSGDPYGTVNGTSSSPISIQADPSAAPGSVIINSPNNKTHVGIDVEPGSAYLNFSGFTLSGSSLSKEAIKYTGNNGVIANNTVSGVGGFGIFVDNTNQTVIKGNTISGTTGSGDTGMGFMSPGPATPPSSKTIPSSPMAISASISTAMPAKGASDW